MFVRTKKKKEREREREFIFSKIPLIHTRNFSRDKLLNIICAQVYFSLEPIFLESVTLQETAEDTVHFPLCIKKQRQHWQIQGKMLGKEYINTITSFDFT